MGWEKPLRNYIIATFSRDQPLLGTLAEYFSAFEGVTIVDLLGMEEGLANKFIDAYGVDIAFIEETSANTEQDGPVYKIIEKASAGRQGIITHFISRYDDQCGEKMLAFGESLLERKLPLIQFRLDDDDDEDSYIILAQNMYSILNEKTRREKALLHILTQELSGDERG